MNNWSSKGMQVIAGALSTSSTTRTFRFGKKRRNCRVSRLLPYFLNIRLPPFPQDIGLLLRPTKQTSALKNTSYNERRMMMMMMMMMMIMMMMMMMMMMIMMVVVVVIMMLQFSFLLPRLLKQTTSFSRLSNIPLYGQKLRKWGNAYWQ